MAWTATNPVSLGEDTKKSEWDNLWDNSDFVYMPSSTIMIWGQTTAPIGWTKKTDWTNNSMLVTTNGAIGAGGSCNPISCITNVASPTGNENSHTHPMPHTHGVGSGSIIHDGAGYSNTTGNPSPASTGAGSAHSHAILQDTFTPRYYQVIAASKDVGSWTAVNPVSAVGEAMKANAHWDVLWANIEYNYIEAATIAFFGQSTPPTGWTKKSDWMNNSMLIYTTGTASSGGSDNPINWTTAISTGGGTLHRHALQYHTHSMDAGVGLGSGSPYVYAPNTNAPTVSNSGYESSHTHGINQDTFTPIYQSVVAAVKSSGSWDGDNPVEVGRFTNKEQYDTAWDNIEFNCFPSGTRMLFGQSTAPTGWTKKLDWTNNAMMVYTTGNISTGGSDNPLNWTTNISVQNESGHVHSLAGHAHYIATGTNIGNISGPRHYITGGPSQTNTSGGTAHAHTITAQGTMTLRYQSIISATKDA